MIESVHPRPSNHFVPDLWIYRYVSDAPAPTLLGFPASSRDGQCCTFHATRKSLGRRISIRNVCQGEESLEPE